MNIVETRGLCKQYGQAMRVKQLNLSVPEGAVYGFLGPNGAGKSTLINIITGSLKQDSGTVQWCSKSARALDIRFRRALGYMPQQQGLYDSYTGRRFLAYLCALKEIPAKETAALRHRAVISSEAVFQNKTNLNAVAKIFRTLQAETGAGILASLFFKGIHSISITNLGVLIVKTKVNDAVKRNVSGSSATSKSAQDSQSSECLFHFQSLTQYV